ncbi:MAG: helix-turn-helix domain-containing protein, partial [Eubacterium sp.]|nr:helix-turn-helix domain-containing protein [Eubacterium sp.]
MEQIQNTISQAAKKLHVGPHVLRFWEDELHLSIPRNEMGHRVYSTKEMQLLEQIIQMKKDGYSL